MDFIRVSEENFYEMLGCLPPAEMGKTREEFIKIILPVSSYFLVGEPMRHINGLPVYECFFKSLGKYWKLSECLPQRRSLYATM